MKACGGGGGWQQAGRAAALTEIGALRCGEGTGRLESGRSAAIAAGSAAAERAFRLLQQRSLFGRGCGRGFWWGCGWCLHAWQRSNERLLAGHKRCKRVLAGRRRPLPYQWRHLDGSGGSGQQHQCHQLGLHCSWWWAQVHAGCADCGSS